MHPIGSFAAFDAVIPRFDEQTRLSKDVNAYNTSIGFEVQQEKYVT